MPLVFKYEGDSSSFSQLSTDIGLALGTTRLIINPGAVGQPRDNDPRASYAIYDSGAGLIKLYRVPYDINATQTRMMENGLPIRLVVRLSYGT